MLKMKKNIEGSLRKKNRSGKSSFFLVAKISSQTLELDLFIQVHDAAAVLHAAGNSSGNLQSKV